MLPSIRRRRPTIRLPVSTDRVDGKVACRRQRKKGTQPNPVPLCPTVAACWWASARLVLRNPPHLGLARATLQLAQQFPCRRGLGRASLGARPPVSLVGGVFVLADAMPGLRCGPILPHIACRPTKGANIPRGLAGMRHGTAGSGHEERPFPKALGRQLDGVLQFRRRKNRLIVLATHVHETTGGRSAGAGQELRIGGCCTGGKKPDGVQNRIGILRRRRRLDDDGQLSVSVFVVSCEGDDAGLMASPAVDRIDRLRRAPST